MTVHPSALNSQNSAAATNPAAAAIRSRISKADPATSSGFKPIRPPVAGTYRNPALKNTPDIYLSRLFMRFNRAITRADNDIQSSRAHSEPIAREAGAATCHNETGGNIQSSGDAAQQCVSLWAEDSDAKGRPHSRAPSEGDPAPESNSAAFPSPTGRRTSGTLASRSGSRLN